MTMQDSWTRLPGPLPARFHFSSLDVVVDGFVDALDAGGSLPISALASLYDSQTIRSSWLKAPANGRCSSSGIGFIFETAAAAASLASSILPCLKRTMAR